MGETKICPLARLKTILGQFRVSGAKLYKLTFNELFSSLNQFLSSYFAGVVYDCKFRYFEIVPNHRKLFRNAFEILVSEGCGNVQKPRNCTE